MGRFRFVSSTSVLRVYDQDVPATNAGESGGTLTEEPRTEALETLQQEVYVLPKKHKILQWEDLHSFTSYYLMVFAFPLYLAFLLDSSIPVSCSKNIPDICDIPPNLNRDHSQCAELETGSA